MPTTQRKPAEPLHPIADGPFDIKGKLIPMKALWHRRPVFWSILAGMTATAAPALATQAHGGLTGIYTHQLAHIFFILSMGILIYWLRQRHLVRQTGWRYIQYAALFFIFWSLDAFLVHLMDDQLEIIHTRRLAPWGMRFPATCSW